MTPPTKRPGTHGDGRDVRTPKTPPTGIAAQIAVPELLGDDDDEITGKYDGDELRAMRARRSPLKRLEHTEDNIDDLRKGFSGLRNDVSDLRKENGERDKLARETRDAVMKMQGEFTVVPRLVDLLEKANEQSAKREMLAVAAKTDVEKAKKLADTEVTKEQQLDNVAARKDRRKAVLLILGGLFSTGVLGALVGWWLA